MNTRLVAFRHALRRPQITFGVLVSLFWFLVVITVNLWAPYKAYEQTGVRLSPPSLHHLFGTDVLGRDVFSRVMYGSRQSIPIAVVVIVFAVLVGSVVGGISGYIGGRLDSFIMRITDVFISFPALLFAMVIAASLGRSSRSTMIAVSVTWWPFYARLVRGQVMSIRNREHIEAAVSIGAGTSRILRKHVLPLTMTPVMVNATSDFGFVVLVVSSLSFLGLGAKPPTPEWGTMVAEGSQNFYQWWLALTPGLAIVTIILGFNFLGDGVRDELDKRSATK